MKGSEYAELVACYLVRNYATRGIEVYREVSVGKSIIGKNRRVDVLVLQEEDRLAYAIECKFQKSHGTVDEKIPYALQDMRAMPIPGCIVYAGSGFSTGVLHMLQAAENAAYCLPEVESLEPTKHTRELDHLLALHFRWWDILVGNKRPVAPS